MHVHAEIEVCFLKSSGVVRDRRVVFAVTQYDHSYDDQKELNTLQVREHIKKWLPVTWQNVFSEDIVTVSGQWALLARQLKKDPENVQCLRRARRCLSRYMECQACGEDQNYNADEEVSLMQAGQVAAELEKASNITQLEAR